MGKQITIYNFTIYNLQFFFLQFFFFFFYNLGKVSIEYLLPLTSIISVCACLLHDVDGGVIVLISTKAFGNCSSSELANLVQAEMDNSL